MPDVEIRPFSDEQLGDAAELLAARHRRHRRSERLLSERYENAGAALGEVEALWRSDGATGWSGFRGGRLVAYVIGTLHPGIDDGHAWIDYAGHAAEEAEDIRDVYAAAAGQWVEEGRPQHYVQVPAHDSELIDSWFRLSFGQQQADGVRDVPARTDLRPPDDVEIRTPTPDDVEDLIAVDLALPQQHRSSPVFSRREPPTADESRKEWQKTLAGDEETLFIGCHRGRPVACWSLRRRTRNFRGLVAPERGCYLSFAATIPEARGLGIGVALTDASLAWAAEQGYAAMGTDWRVTNLLASRFWPRRGFRTTFLRLYRHIP